MRYGAAVPSNDRNGFSISRAAVSQAEVDNAYADYCKAMSFYGRDSAEVVVADRVWKHLRWSHARGAGTAVTL